LVLLPDGRVMASISSSDRTATTFAAFDESSGTWTSLNGNFRSNNKLTLLNDGRVLASAPVNGQLFDPTSGTWAATIGATFRSATAAFLLSDARVWVSSDVTAEHSLTRSYAGGIYDPVAPEKSISIGGGGPASVLLPDGRVLSAASPSGDFISDPIGGVTEWTAPAVSREGPMLLLYNGKALFVSFVGSASPILSQLYEPISPNNPFPVVTSIEAPPSLLGTNSSSLVINGLNFLPNSRVQLGNSALVSLYLGSKKIIAFVPAALRGLLDSTSLTVTNLGPGGGNSTPMTIGSLPSPPTIVSISPSSGIAGTTINAVITGTNLAGATSVVFSSPGTTASIQSGASAAILPITLTISTNAAVGAVSITVTTAGGMVTAENAFSVQIPTTIPSTTPQPIAEVEQGNVRSGYFIITPEPNSSVPTLTATFGLLSAGVVQSQAGMFPGSMTTDVSLFIEVIPAIARNLGVAIANPGSVINVLTITLRDTNGNVVGTPTTVALRPREQVARFVDELLSREAIGSGFQGSLRVQSSVPFALIGLRFSGAEFSTIPAAQISTAGGVPSRILTAGSTASSPFTGTVGGNFAVMLPQFAIGGGWATQIALVNNGNVSASGRVDIFDALGNPMPAKLNGTTQSTFTYSIPAGGTFVLAPRDVNAQSPF